MTTACWFRHDSNARWDTLVCALRQKFGHSGYAVYFMLLEIMREQLDLKLSKDLIESYAMQMQCTCDALQEMLSCMYDLGLFKHDKKYFWSVRLIRDAAEYNLQREKKIAAANKRWMHRICDAPADGDAPHMQNDAIRIEGSEGSEGSERINVLTVPASAGSGNGSTPKPRKLSKRAITPRPTLDDITPEQVQAFKIAFPELNIGLELQAAKNWTANKGKIHKAPQQFFENWCFNAIKYKGQEKV